MQTHQVSKTNYKVSDFIAWAKARTLILSPSFQRRPLWPVGAKSFLLDTIVRGFPIPIIFLREQKTDLNTLEPKREVVDGQQRIRTLLAFVLPTAVKNFDPDRDSFTIKSAHNKELAGKAFKDLPSEVRQNILDYQFSVHILSSSVDDREVLQIFARMNATGFKLNAQELRNAAFFGEFKTSMYAISAEQLPRWRKWRIFTEAQIARMAEVEITSEFAQLMMKGVVGKTQKAIDTLYEELEDEWPERAEVERRFRHCMEELDNTVGADLANTQFRNRAPFHGLFAAVYNAAFDIGSALKKKKSEPLPANFKARVLKISDTIHDVKAPDKVLEALARRTTHKDSRKTVSTTSNLNSLVPRPTTALSDDFTARLRTFERARAKFERLLLSGLVTRHDVCLFYEGIFLRTVTSFEGLLEELFVGLLTGAITPAPNVRPRVTFRSPSVARDVMLGGKAYVDWLPYRYTEKRAKAFFRAGEPFSNLTKPEKKSLERMLTIRNAVAHQSRSARKKLEDEVIGTSPLLPAERTPAGFLRSVFRATPPQTQYEDIAATCAQLARKLCT